MSLSKLLSIKTEFIVAIYHILTLLDTQYYRNTALENKLFYIRRKRPDPPLEAVLDSMLKMFKKNPNGMVNH